MNKILKPKILKYLVSLLIAFMACSSLLAQKKTSVTVRAGDNIMDVLPRNEIFFYPEFTTVQVFLRDGTVSQVQANYNRLVDEIHFINEKGDTLALDNENNLKFVTVVNDTFFYDDGYLRIISSGKAVKLAVREIWIISETRQLGAYGSTNNSVRMISFRSMHEGGRLYDLIVNEDVVLKKTTKYYFADSFNQFVPASKSNLLMLVPNEERRISTYLKENRINFNNRADLEKTVQFIEQLLNK